MTAFRRAPCVAANTEHLPSAQASVTDRLRPVKAQASATGLTFFGSLQEQIFHYGFESIDLMLKTLATIPEMP